jgi:hypothetical protein
VSRPFSKNLTRLCANSVNWLAAGYRLGRTSQQIV